MKYLIVPVLFLFAVTAFAQVPAIAVIDAQKVVRQSEMGKRALAEIQGLKDKKQQEMDQRQNSIQAMQDKLEKQKDIMTADQREKTNAEIQKGVTDLRRFKEDAENDIQDRLGRAIKSIEDRVLPIIQKIGEERGYAVIIQREQLIYYNAKNDITDEVIKQFNDAVAKGNVPPPAPKKP